MVGNSSIITEDLSCPFVLGAHYNGEAKSGYHNADNRVKAIHTKSGHKLIFTEDESILLTDKNGNVIKLDTQGKNIEISAPETVSISCRRFVVDTIDNIEINSGGNLTEKVSKHKNITIKGDYSVGVLGKMMEIVRGNRETKAQEIKENSKNRQINSQMDNSIHTQKTFNNNSGEKSKIK